MTGHGGPMPPPPPPLPPHTHVTSRMASPPTPTQALDRCARTASAHPSPCHCARMASAPTQAIDRCAHMASAHAGTRCCWLLAAHRRRWRLHNGGRGRGRAVPPGGAPALRIALLAPLHGPIVSSGECEGSITRESSTGRAPGSPRTGVNQESKSCVNVAID